MAAWLLLDAGDNDPPPSEATDKEASARLLASMMSPGTVAEWSVAFPSLPTSRPGARDPRFQQIPQLQVSMDLMARPNPNRAVTAPIRPELNKDLRQIERELLHREGAIPLPLLNEIHAQLLPRLSEGLVYLDEQ
jgi:hypothetical protein